MVNIKENTKLFFEELEKENCDYEKLLLLSKKGIYLNEVLFYNEKLKNHEYLVDISFNNNQFIRISNERQYLRVRYFIKNNFEPLIVFNNCFISFLLKETDIKFLSIFSYLYEPELTIYHLYKHEEKYLESNYISHKVFNLFQPKGLQVSSIIYILIHDYFYLYNNRKLNLINITKYINKTLLINTIINNFGSDKKILDYIINNFDEKVYSFSNFSRVPMNYPMEMMYNYINKIFKPNYLICKSDNELLNSQINTIFSDKFINEIHDLNYLDMNYQGNMKYNSIIDKYFGEAYYETKYEVINDNYEEKYKIERKIYNNYDEDELWFGNKKLFPHIYGRLDNDNLYNKYNNYYSYYKEQCEKFVKKYLNHKLESILNDPYKIFKISKEYRYNLTYKCMIQISFIIALMYNKAPLVIIFTLIALSDCNFIYKNETIFFDLNCYEDNKTYYPLECAIYDTLSSIEEFKFNSFVSVSESYYYY
ncbi:hypothetical protein U3516DRAFT_673307 [Neocallimastix sp. 'constans']